MAHHPYHHESDLPGSERPTNNPDIPSAHTAERPPQYKECGHTGNGCTCGNSEGYDRRDPSRASDVDSLNPGLMSLHFGGEDTESDNDIDLESASSLASHFLSQIYRLPSPNSDEGVNSPEHIYDFLTALPSHHDRIAQWEWECFEPDDLDAPFEPMPYVRDYVRSVSPIGSMAPNYDSGSGGQSLRSSMHSSMMARSGTPSYFTRCAGARWLELTPPLSPSGEVS